MQGSTRPEAGQAGTADEGGASDGRKGHGKGRALKVSPQARFDPGCFLKTVNRYGYSPLAVEWDLWQVYVSSSLGAAFNYACVALYFESAVLVAHPVPEVRVLHPWLSWGASRALLGFSLES